jgi:hypothetical protein
MDGSISSLGHTDGDACTAFWYECNVDKFYESGCSFTPYDGWCASGLKLIENGECVLQETRTLYYRKLNISSFLALEIKHKVHVLGMEFVQHSDVLTTEEPMEFDIEIVLGEECDGVCEDMLHHIIASSLGVDMTFIKVHTEPYTTYNHRLLSSKRKKCTKKVKVNTWDWHKCAKWGVCEEESASDIDIDPHHSYTFSSCSLSPQQKWIIGFGFPLFDDQKNNGFYIHPHNGSTYTTKIESPNNSACYISLNNNQTYRDMVLEFELEHDSIEGQLTIPIWSMNDKCSWGLDHGTYIQLTATYLQDNHPIHVSKTCSFLILDEKMVENENHNPSFYVSQDTTYETEITPFGKTQFFWGSSSQAGLQLAIRVDYYGVPQDLRVGPPLSMHMEENGKKLEGHYTHAITGKDHTCMPFFVHRIYPIWGRNDFCQKSICSYIIIIRSAIVTVPDTGYDFGVCGNNVASNIYFEIEPESCDRTELANCISTNKGTANTNRARVAIKLSGVVAPYVLEYDFGVVFFPSLVSINAEQFHTVACVQVSLRDGSVPWTNMYDSCENITHSMYLETQVNIISHSKREELCAYVYVKHTSLVSTGGVGAVTISLENYIFVPITDGGVRLDAIATHDYLEHDFISEINTTLVSVPPGVTGFCLAPAEFLDYYTQTYPDYTYDNIVYIEFNGPVRVSISPNSNSDKRRLSHDTAKSVHGYLQLNSPSHETSCRGSPTSVGDIIRFDILSTICTLFITYITIASVN